MEHRVPDLYLHVGLQKTGTTTVQSALKLLRRQLHQRGVGYIDRRDIIRLKSYRGSAATTLRDEKKSKRFQEEFSQLVFDFLERTKKRSGCAARALLISNEAMLGVHAKGPRLEEGFRPRAEGAVGEMISIVRPERTHVLLYTRRQDTMLESLYMHQVHAAQSFEFEEFFLNEMSEHRMYLHQLAARLKRIDGVTSLRVRPYEIISAGAVPFISDLLSPLELTDLDWSVLDDLPRKNPSYSSEALRIALKANPHIQSRRERLIFKRILSAAFPIAEHGRAPLLTEEQRKQLIDHYRQDNEQLFRDFMPEFPVETYSSEKTKELLRGRSP